MPLFAVSESQKELIMTTDPIDKRAAASMINHLRQQDIPTAHKVAMINILWSFYDVDLEVELVSDEKADQILSEMPTTFERED